MLVIFWYLLLIFQDSHLFGSHRQQWMKAPQNKLNERVMNLKQPPSYKCSMNHRIHCQHHQAHSHNKCAPYNTFLWQHKGFKELKAGLTWCSWRGRRVPFPSWLVFLSQLLNGIEKLSTRPGQPVPAHPGPSEALHTGKVSTDPQIPKHTVTVKTNWEKGSRRIILFHCCVTPVIAECPQGC